MRSRRTVHADVLRRVPVRVRRVEALEPRTLLAAVFWDGGGDGTSWADPANWSADQAPAPGDDVTIDVLADPLVRITGPQSIGSLASAEAIDLGGGGALSVDRTSVVSGPFTLSNGNLGGAGDVTFNGRLDWQVGEMLGPGRTVVGAGGLLTLSGGGVITLSRTIVNDGTTRWTSGLIVFAGGAFDNNGTFEADSPGNLQALGSVGPGPGNRFINRGTFTKTGGGPLTFQLSSTSLPFDSTGPVNVVAGSLGIGSGGMATGGFAVGPAGTLSFDAGYVYGPGCSVGGPGELRFGGGTHVFAPGQFAPSGVVHFTLGDITVNDTFVPSALGPIGATVRFNANQTFSNIPLVAGELAGTGDVTVTGVFEWGSGTLAGTGSTRIGPTGTLNLSGSIYTVSRTLVNDGTANWTSGLLLVSGGRIDNNGTFNAIAGAAALQAGGGLSAPPVPNAFNNNGVFNKVGPGAAAFTVISALLPFNNAGLVNLTAGTLDLACGGAHFGDIVGAAGATLGLGGDHAFAPGADINGNLSVHVAHGAATYPGALSTTGTVTVAGGTFTVGGAVTAARFDATGGTAVLESAATFTSGAVSGGVLAGAGTVTFAGTLDWRSGAMEGAGRTVILPGATLNLSGSIYTVSRMLVNDGTANWTSGLLLVSGGRIDNNGTFNAIAGDAALQAGGGLSAPPVPNAFNNNGVFNKLGPGAAAFTVISALLPFNNAGLVNLTAGTLDLACGGAHFGDIVGAAGATLGLGGDHAFPPGADINGNLSVHVASGNSTYPGVLSTTGAVTMSGGTLTVGGTVAAARLEMTGGTAVLESAATFTSGAISGGVLAGAGTVTFAGTVDWGSGAIEGAGRTVILPGATLNLSGSIYTLSRTLVNDGTANWTSGLLLVSGGRIDNNGTFNAIAGDAALQAGGGLSAPPVPNAFNNDGTFNALGPNAVSLTVLSGLLPLVNSGVVNLVGGPLVLNCGGTSSGQVNVTGGDLTIVQDVGSEFRVTGGAITVGDGREVIVSGGPLEISGGTLRGTGTVVGDVTNGGAVAPGLSPGMLTVNGSLASSPTANFVVEINGVAPGGGHDVLRVNGAVAVAGSITAQVGFATTPGQTFTIVENDGTDRVIGQFGGLPEGAAFMAGAACFQISYVGGTGNDVTLLAVATCDPAVARMYVSGSQWTASFLDYIQQRGLGSAEHGFAVGGGAAQLLALPWTGVDRITVLFNGPVQVRQDQLAVRGSRVAAYPSNGFAYDNDSNTARWTFPAGAFSNDKLLFDLDGGADGVRNGAGTLLDGEWNNGSGAFPSGDGSPGGDFRFRVNVLAGDVNHGGVVLADDFSAVKARFFRTTQNPGTGQVTYTIFHDLNGNGAILADDFSAVKARFFQRLPGPEPAGVPGATGTGGWRGAAPVREGVLSASAGVR